MRRFPELLERAPRDCPFPSITHRSALRSVDKAQWARGAPGSKPRVQCFARDDVLRSMDALRS